MRAPGESLVTGSHENTPFHGDPQATGIEKKYRIREFSNRDGPHLGRVAGILVPDAVTLRATGLLAGRRLGASAPSRSPRDEPGHRGRLGGVIGEGCLRKPP